MSLAEQEIGFEGKIADLVGDDFTTTRLRELGIIRGEIIRLQGKAPFGDPFIVEVHGISLALRKSEAQCIHV